MKKETINLIALIIIGILGLCIPSGNPQEPNNNTSKQDTLIIKK
jgi:hypothetical protein